ncbi:golgin subfamily A member 6-like protein 22 [Schistocerca piceifrons]|uniref:golgin subfamily A member 6-like protein 22 n=1 Tax=Schistocerca piceifrons TaxID=274613 RepID=UPI001F5F5794|nr:golgin subfamily A member 6-like protein 22 [Schistocerca piceifrons]XP_047113658.1 golgin subfamily A member 6-like protein 22 [Schistocerca piceifrons]XP_047113659.1 golgin subfamily A member 6-like protein 22 [Schistocerca piceifrons]
MQNIFTIKRKSKVNNIFFTFLYMDEHDTDGNKAWREWYRKKHKLETEKRQLAKEQREKEKKSREEDQIKKEKRCKETWIAWLQKKEAAKKQEKIKKELQNSLSVVRHSKDPLEQQKKVDTWMEQKLAAAKRSTLSQHEKAEQEKRQQLEMILHKGKCKKAFEEWKKQKANFKRPASCITTNRDKYQYTGYQHPQPWQD